MAEGVDTRIMEAFYDALRDLASYPIAWPARAFSPPAGPYWRVAFLPAQPEAFSLAPAGSNDHRGIFQVSLLWPEGDKGPGETVPREVAAVVVEHFKRGTVLDNEGVRVRIISPPWAAALLSEPGRVHVPVSIPYVAFVPNQG